MLFKLVIASQFRFLKTNSNLLLPTCVHCLILLQTKLILKYLGSWINYEINNILHSLFLLLN